MLSDAEIMAQVRAAFQEEQAEHRQAIVELLLELERAPTALPAPAIAQLFREAHSLKGGAAAAGQHEVEQIAHGIEDLFSAVRSGHLALTPALCDPLYAALDAIGSLMAASAAGAPISLEPYQPILHTLAATLNALPPPEGGDRAGPAIAEADDDGQAESLQEAKKPSADPATVRLATTTLDTLLNETGELIAYTIRARQRTQDVQSLSDIPQRWRRAVRKIKPLMNRLRSREAVIQPTIHHLEGRQGFRAPAPNDLRLEREQDLASLLEALALAETLMSELDRRLGAHNRQAVEDHSRLMTVTDRLHGQIRQTRMRPIRSVLSPLRLQVRDIARAAGKAVHFILNDGEVEADREVLDHLREVLTHLLRNAIDHGIEDPAQRLALGKPAEGAVVLHATVSGDHLHLTLIDDGAGIVPEHIRHQAASTGLYSPAELSAMDKDQLLDLIFIPGFSTRQRVSVLSGRGVGLDIARSHIQRVHGQLTVESTPGAGTRFLITVPLSMASSQSLLIMVGPECYALPMEPIKQIIAFVPDVLQTIEGHSAILIQGRPVLVVRLRDILGAAHGRGAPAKGSAAPLLVLLGSGERQVACLVDAVVGEQELVVHRLPEPLRRVPFIASATIMADGQIVPILDVGDIVRAAIRIRRPLSPDDAPAAAPARQSILVVDDSLTTRTLEKNILEAAGYQVRLATNGVEALAVLREMFATDGCDLLLTDIDMPHLDGFELTAQIRGDEDLRYLPIVLVTSLDTAADRERGITAGANAYITKRTFDQNTLVATIRHLL